MTEEQIGNILRVIGTANVSEEQRGSATADVLQLAAETFTKQVFTSLLSAKPNEIKGEEEKAPQPRGRQKTGIRFTKQEMKKMPMKYRKIFAHEDIIVPYRLRKDGVYEARVRRKDLHIEVSARDFDRTAEKLAALLRCIFDVAADDYKIPSPMAKVVLPRYQTKKGSALTYEEEAKLVRYCRENADNAATDAILALLYFGMRQSELATMRVTDGKWLEIETSKERLGQDVVLRRAPFTPMARKVLPLIDFEKARTTNTRTIASTIKRVLPDHHVHELRHTYVSRCKECGVAGEVVSIWVGHSLTGTITSTVYTHYSEEFQLREAEKVNYAL